MGSIRLRLVLLMGFALVVGLLACGGGGGSDSGGNNNATTGTVAGTVSSSVAASSIAEQAALSEVTVAIGSQSATTDSTGNYRISNVEAGTHSITATKSGYQTYTGTVTVVSGQTVSHDISLTASSPGGTDTDTQAPSVPSGLTATTTSTSQIDLSWTASTDNVGVTGYKVYRGGTLLKQVTGISTSDTGLSASTQYCYQVSALDAAGNESNKSPQACATTNSSGSTGTGTHKLPDTGQTDSYTTTFGEDSDYLINPPSYTDNGNGTITDNVTSLMWQKEDDNITRDWTDAGAYCDGLSLAGHSDWRLPNIKELESIVKNEPSSFFDVSINWTYFPGTSGFFYWSSTPYVGNTSGAWGVVFRDGTLNEFGKPSKSYVRCVRGEQLAYGDFVNNSDGTITDRSSSLTWQQAEGGAKTWEDALTYCEGLSLAGQANWRLPNKRELMSIVDYSKYLPSIDRAYFPNANSSEYWSSTTMKMYLGAGVDYRYDTNFAFHVNFNVGSVNVYGSGKIDAYSVRCVRGGVGGGGQEVRVQGGCFQMGDTFGDGNPNELPVHQVCLDSFYMDKYEVTQAEYQAVMGTNPSYFTSCGANCPVETVTWFNASDYCVAVGKRLPTEAEWEYAARSGGQSQKWAGTSTQASLGNYAWYGANSGETTHPVGTKLPNGLGLYDMSGNVWEWVADWSQNDYYSISPQNNPTGPSSGSDRVLRGGCWVSDAGYARASYRNWINPGSRYGDLGFRCSRTP